MAKETNNKPAKKSETQAPRRHRMVVGRQPLSEGGRFYAAGEPIDLPAARLKALGSLVQPAAETEDSGE